MTAPTTGLWPVVAATGHRPKHLPGAQQAWVRDNLAKAVAWLIANQGTQVAISGFALGTDLWWAKAAADAGLTLGAHIPCPQQTERWTAGWVAEWKRLYALRDEQWSRVVAPKYSYEALFARNLGMLRAATAVIAVWNPAIRKGGTFDALCQAWALRKPGIHLNPADRSVTFHLPVLGRRKDASATAS